MKNVKKISMATALCMGLSAVSVSAAQFGVCTHMGLGNGYDNSANVQSAKDVKVAWVRDECRWNYMQSGPGGEFQIRSKDEDYIKRVDEAGINQLLIFAYGNTNYDIEVDTDFPTQDNMTYYNGFLDYVRYTVGQVGEYVDAYELWNEPNIEGFNNNLLADGEDYAKLYLDVKEIVDELDPSATLLCGALTGYGTNDLKFGKDIFNYIKSQGDVNSLIEAFSIHLYTQLSDEKYATGLSKWEEVFDSYGYTGDVWMTENGVTADNDKAGNESDQAAMIAKIGMQWEAFLKNNNRNGVNFWYDLRNDVGISDYEDNFGLVDSFHVMKPSGYAMATYNELVGKKKFDSLQKVKTKDNWFTSDEYGYVGKYKDNIATTYVVYDTNNNGKSTEISLSGDIAYVYDCLGNITETIENPSGTKSIKMTSSPVYVQCVGFNSRIDNLNYDEDNGVVSVSGEYVGESVTIEALQGDEVLYSKTVSVENNKFDTWFSLLGNGDCVIRVGRPEILAAGKVSGWDESVITLVGGVTNPGFDVSTAVAYDAASRKVSVSGTISNYGENQNVTVLAIPKTMDVNQIDLRAVAFVKQIDTNAGEFSAVFSVPEYFTTEMSIYLGGTGIMSTFKSDAGVLEGDYVYVASLDINSGDTLSASAVVRNFTESDKKASIIIAQYDIEGKLLNMEIEEKTVSAKTYEAVEVSLSDVSKESGVHEAKAFIVSDLTGFVPLSELSKTDMN